jgi:hypothetical protein
VNVTIDIPESTVEQFRKAFGPDLSGAATEALLINGYRTGRISLGFVASVLGLPTHSDAQQWLAERKVPMNYDLEELEADRETLRKQFNVNI